MNEIYEFTKVNAFTEDPIKHIISFNTDIGKRIWIQDDKLGNPDIQFVRRALAEGRVIFVAYESNTGLCRFAGPFNKDYVNSIAFNNKSPPVLEVTLVLRPSYLFLLPSHPRFQELQRILENVNGKDQLVWVGTFPGDSMILDVRLPIP